MLFQDSQSKLHQLGRRPLKIDDSSSAPWWLIAEAQDVLAPPTFGQKSLMPVFSRIKVRVSTVMTRKHVSFFSLCHVDAQDQSSQLETL